MHEQAEITKESINNLTQAHTKQMEALIKLTTDAMKEMLAIFKTNTGNQNQKNGNQPNTDEEKKEIHEERKQKFKDAPACKYCGKKHPYKKEEECWVLKANAASQLANWKPTKNTSEIAGSLIETEFWQPGKVIDNIENHTHLEFKNYWTPLEEEEDKAEKEEASSHSIHKTEIKISNNKPRNRPGGRQRTAMAKKKSIKLVIDLGAMSHFICEEANLPTTGEINTNIYLPDDAMLRATSKTQLPIPRLSNKAKDAKVVPGLKQNLGRVSKFSQVGYTTIFHPGKEGVVIHEPNTFCITTTKQPFLQGCKTKGLWTVTLNNATEDRKQEKVNNVYNIPSIKEAMRYLHAAADFPVKETWVEAIRAGSFITWLGITVKTVNQHFQRIGGNKKRSHEKATSKREINKSKRGIDIRIK
jgi:hypothetical protein